MTRLIDLTGSVFGRLTVIRRAPNTGSGARWECRCECGTTRIVQANNLRKREGTKSCGCLTREIVGHTNSTHGKTGYSEYRIWLSMRNRCHRTASNNYGRYGGRGIKVCDGWRSSFEAFYADMGPRPSPSHSLDRIDNDGNYEPGNCRWATPDQQGSNTRRSLLITYNGRTLTAAQWADERGVSRSAMWWRLTKSGWPVDRALTEPVRAR